MAPSFHATDANDPPPRQPPAYYNFPSIDLSQRFKDFDNLKNLVELDARVRNTRCQSFVLDYGHDEAWCAFDLAGNELSKLLITPRPAAINSRWIHIWYPHLQDDRIKAIAKTYNFSPRLAGLMCSKPLAKRPTEVKEDGHSHHFHWHHTSPKSPMRASVDSEQGRELAPIQPGADSKDLLESLGHYDIVNSIWHWSSIDMGKKYLCLGFNTLHKVTMDGWERSPFDLPNGERIWNWLVLCDDKTVISITESSLVAHDGDASDTRHNLLNVFRQLSKATDRSKRNPISIVPVRYALADEDTPTDTAGLLFYYLFDDWYSTYSLLAKSEHQYGSALHELREKMMIHAELSHVDQLFRLGRQLATLKRMYQSYELLIDKVLEKLQQESGTPDVSALGNQVPIARRQSNSTRELLGIHLSADALVRFERLRDRIRLYVLSEINECIDTKDSLLMMNFNLITIKESDAVERLTRITILLAKVTIMFLPVSLMTGYFSVQIPDLHFTVAAYWTSFAVVLAVSFVALVIFGMISGTAEGNMVYRPIYKLALDLIKGRVARQRAT